ncbi:MAG TPA: sulfur oxidation c-type cytochrome SoxA [Burkholderiales bacterium]|nr:sulfur oxidation c-type cytochrome SoxA [Burkholderiales bacterium]
MTRALALCAVAAFAAAIPALQAAAQSKPPVERDATTEEFEKFREVLEADNPAELFEVKGAELWKTPRGPKNASLAACDLGLGPGVVKGAYVQLPRYFADAGKVMDAERRIVYCMVTLQGFDEAALAKAPFSTETRTPDPVALTTFVAGQSRGMKIAPPQTEPQERAAYALGREIFFYRAGSYDFACASCHGEDGRRIRTQQLPNLTRADGAIRGYQGWPGYRMTGGVMHTLQWRLNDCFRQERFPEPQYLSDSLTALLTYLAVNAKGQVYKGPGIKR